MTQTWLIVADGARARFFERKSASELSEFDVMVSPEGRTDEGSLASDRPGRSFDSRGDGRHAMEPGHSARDLWTSSCSLRHRAFSGTCGRA